MDYSCCAILCSIFVRDNPSPHSSKRLVKENTPWKKQYTIVRKHDTIKGWNKWWSDNTTSTSTRKRIIVLAYQVDCSFFLSFRFPSNIHSQGIISIERWSSGIPAITAYSWLWILWNNLDMELARFDALPMEKPVILFYSSPLMVTITASASPSLVIGCILENA